MSSREKFLAGAVIFSWLFFMFSGTITSKLHNFYEDNFESPLFEGSIEVIDELGADPYLFVQEVVREDLHGFRDIKVYDYTEAGTPRQVCGEISFVTKARGKRSKNIVWKEYFTKQCDPPEHPFRFCVQFVLKTRNGRERSFGPICRESQLAGQER